MAKPGYESRSGASHPRWNEGRMIGSNGYVKIRVGVDHPLADPNGYAYEHLIVWVSAGRPKPPKGWLLHHKDEVKTNNRLDNLEMKEKDRHGVDHAARLTDLQVIEIRMTYDQGDANIVQLGAAYGVPFQSIWKLIRGVTRKRVGGPIQSGSLRGRKGSARPQVERMAML